MYDVHRYDDMGTVIVCTRAGAIRSVSFRAPRVHRPCFRLTRFMCDAEHLFILFHHCGPGTAFSRRTVTRHAFPVLRALLYIIIIIQLYVIYVYTRTVCIYLLLSKAVFRNGHIHTISLSVYRARFYGQPSWIRKTSSSGPPAPPPCKTINYDQFL